MSKIRSLSFLVLVAASLALQGCSWFDKHVEPVLPAVVTCSGETIPSGTVKEVWDDLTSKNYADLLANVFPLLHEGWTDLVCIIDALEATNPQWHEPAVEFKRQHAVEIRNAKPLSMNERAAIHISLADGQEEQRRRRRARGHRVAHADSRPGGGPGLVGGGGEGGR